MEKESVSLSAKRLSVFITAESIIIAALLVWAQYWTNTYDIYINSEPPELVWHIGLTVAIIFMAVFLSILSVVFALCSFNKRSHDFLPRLSVSMSFTSVVSMLIVIIMSLVGLFSAASSNQPWHASSLVTFLNPYKCAIRYIAFVGIPFLALLIHLFLSKCLVTLLFVDKFKGENQ